MLRPLRLLGVELRLGSLLALLDLLLRLGSLAASRTGPLSIFGASRTPATAAPGSPALALAASRLAAICSCVGGPPPNPGLFFTPLDPMAAQASGKEKLGELLNTVNNDEAVWHAPSAIDLGST